MVVVVVVVVVVAGGAVVVVLEVVVVVVLEVGGVVDVDVLEEVLGVGPTAVVEVVCPTVVDVDSGTAVVVADGAAVDVVVDSEVDDTTEVVELAVVVVEGSCVAAAVGETMDVETAEAGGAAPSRDVVVVVPTRLTTTAISLDSTTGGCSFPGGGDWAPVGWVVSVLNDDAAIAMVVSPTLVADTDGPSGRVTTRTATRSRSITTRVITVALRRIHALSRLLRRVQRSRPNPMSHGPGR